MKRFLVAIAVLSIAGSQAFAQPATAPVRKTNLARDTYLFSAPEGNLVVYDGGAGWVAAGVMSTSLARAAQQLVDARPGRRGYAIALVSDSAAAYADGGFASHGAVTIAHENLRHRIAQRYNGRSPAPLALTTLGFSEVIQVYVPGEDTHAVHQKPGYSDADVSVHLERAGVLVLGSIFTADGYPDIDANNGGNFSGLLETVTTFANNFGSLPTVVPARGPAVSGRVLRDYVGMLTSVRNRVQQLVSAGRSLDQVIAARPSAEFDARWGHGRVTPAAFVTEVYTGLRSR